MDKEKLVYLDGEYLPQSQAKLSVYDHGFLYGDGVFEGIRAYNGRVLKLKEHIDRLYASAKAIYLTIPVSKEEMFEIVLSSFRKNNITDGYCRLVVSRGVGDLGLDPKKSKNPSIICIANNIQLYPKEMYNVGIPIVTASQRRNKANAIDPQIKSLNYLNNILAKIEAGRCGVQEAVMLNEDGIVAECTGDNIFIVKDNIIYTPPISVGILEGITRNIFIDLAKKNGIETYEKEFTLFNLYNADECFLTGTGAEAMPVIKVDERIIGTGEVGAITKKLLELFHNLVRNEGEVIFK
ncbi:MAG: branched-chain-amino-acid transaminase [Spirochaetes bacterium GWC1_27_15]|nr:MAG: branched-chain-amino-acid transaminase [Spirochaetes bacterium GWB1_27_13]OHD26559.1 MAG: branched-chain-amino-acid transaminase [Spirochaetes bacterium GWC1_27_15]